MDLSFRSSPLEYALYLMILRLHDIVFKPRRNPPYDMKGIVHPLANLLTRWREREFGENKWERGVKKRIQNNYRSG